MHMPNEVRNKSWQTMMQDAHTHLPMTCETWCAVFGVQLLSKLELFSLQKLEEK